MTHCNFSRNEGHDEELYRFILETEVIQQALRAVEGNITQAAETPAEVAEALDAFSREVATRVLAVSHPHPFDAADWKQSLATLAEELVDDDTELTEAFNDIFDRFAPAKNKANNAHRGNFIADMCRLLLGGRVAQAAILAQHQLDPMLMETSEEEVAELQRQHAKQFGSRVTRVNPDDDVDDIVDDIVK